MLQCFFSVLITTKFCSANRVSNEVVIDALTCLIIQRSTCVRCQDRVALSGEPGGPSGARGAPTCRSRGRARATGPAPRRRRATLAVAPRLGTPLKVLWESKDLVIRHSRKENMMNYSYKVFSQFNQKCLDRLH